MRRTSLLSLATAAGVAATVLAVAAPASPAAADVMPADDPPAASQPIRWGPFYSKKYYGTRAVAVGRVWEDSKVADFEYEVRVYDKSPQSWLCAFVEVKGWNESEGLVDHLTRKKCGPKGYAHFRAERWEEDVPDTIKVRVCHWNKKTATKVGCGKWKLAYRWVPKE